MSNKIIKISILKFETTIFGDKRETEKIETL
jgi:hypothetical protein